MCAPTYLPSAVLRKARARATWGTARRAFRDVFQRTRDARTTARRPVRLSAALRDALECHKRDLATRRNAHRGHVVPARSARLQLTTAATVGPVLLDMCRALVPRGDG